MILVDWFVSALTFIGCKLALYALYRFWKKRRQRKTVLPQYIELENRSTPSSSVASSPSALNTTATPPFFYPGMRLRPIQHDPDAPTLLNYVRTLDDEEDKILFDRGAPPEPTEPTNGCSRFLEECCFSRRKKYVLKHKTN